MRQDVKGLTQSGTKGRSSVAIERDALSWKGGKFRGTLRQAVGDGQGAGTTRQGRRLCKARFLRYRRRRRKTVQWDVLRATTITLITKTGNGASCTTSRRRAIW